MNEIKQVIIQIERDFCKLVKEKGIKEGFLYYAAEDAVLNRDNKIIRGKDNIKVYFEEQDLRYIDLDWEPDFVDISKARDMAYTYGSYVLTSQKDTDKPVKNKGIFHTVWKLQPDGSWKYVYD